MLAHEADWTPLALEAANAEIGQPRPGEIARGTRFQTPHVELCFEGGKPPSVPDAVGVAPVHFPDRLRQQVQGGLTIARNERIHVYQAAQSIR